MVFGRVHATFLFLIWSELSPPVEPRSHRQLRAPSCCGLIYPERQGSRHGPVETRRLVAIYAASELLMRLT
jgi:hypothetical protein